MLNPMWSTVMLLLCFTFIMLDHCSVLAMQSGRNINAAPFIPQQQQQQQQQEQQQRQWQQDQEYGTPPYHHQPMSQEHSHLYGSPQQQYHQHQPNQQIPPQHFEESNFYGMPSSPPQHHQSIQQFPEHLGHQFQPQHLGGHQQMFPSSPPQTFSPMEDFTSPHLISPLLPAHYERNEPVGGRHVEEPYEFDDLMKNVVNFAVKSGEKGEKDKLIAHEHSRLFNPFFASSSPSNDPLRHLTSLLQTIPQGTSLFSETPASIGGTSKHATKPLNPIGTISTSATGPSRITEPNAAVIKDNTEKFTFGTINDNLLISMADKEPEKPKSRGIPPGFPAKTPTGITTHKQETRDVFPVKVMPKYLEAVKKPLAPPSTSNPSVKEAQIKPKSPNTVETGKAAIPEENIGIKIEGAPNSKASDSDDKMPWRKQEISSTAGASSTKPEGASSKNKYSSVKSKGQKKNQGKQKGNNNNQGQSSTKISTNVAPKEAQKTIPAEFLPTNKGKQGKSHANPSDSDANKFMGLPTEDEELDPSFIDKIKLESDSEKEMSGSSSDFSDAQDRGSEDDNFFDALQFFETKDKKKTAKQMVRVKELADAKAIEEFAKKCKQELENAKGKAKVEELPEGSNKEIEEKSTKNKEKLKAAKERLELYKNVDRSSLAYKKDWIKLQHHNERNTAINTDSTRATSEMLQEIPVETPVDHLAEIKSLLNIISSDKITQISIDDDKIDENQAKKDIRYLLYTIQVFYEALYKYWHKNYKFHNRVEYLYIDEVLTKIGQFYTNKENNEEGEKFVERAKDSFKKSMHILSNVWTIPKYREFMESQVFNKDEGKNKYVKWMEALQQLLDDLKLFRIKIERFNRSNAKKNGSLDRLKAHFKKSTIQQYFEKTLNQKFRTIFGIVYVGMDKQGFGKILQKKGTLSVLNYLQQWLPDQKANLAHIRKVMWNYFAILDYIKIKEIRADFKTHFQTIMGHPMPEGNYIEDERSGCINKTVYNAVKRIEEIRETIPNGNPYKITPVIQNALDVYKEHILCANFMLIMLQDMYATLDMETKDKHDVHMTIDERNFWHIVDKDKCIPAEENFKKIENIPEFQEFLANNGIYKNTIDDAIKALNTLNVEYKIEERRREAMGQCECCKPEEGYDKDSEEEKEGLEREQKPEEADKEEEKAAVKQDIVYSRRKKNR